MVPNKIPNLIYFGAKYDSSSLVDEISRACNFQYTRKWNPGEFRQDITVEFDDLFSLG